MLLNIKYTKILFLKNSITKVCMCVLSYKTGRKKCVICLHHLPSPSAVLRSRQDKTNIAVIFSRADLTSLIIADTPSPGQSASDYLDVVVIKFNDFLSPPWKLIICLSSEVCTRVHWSRLQWEEITSAQPESWVCVLTPPLIGKILFYMLIISSLSTLLGCNYKI